MLLGRPSEILPPVVEAGAVDVVDYLGGGGSDDRTVHIGDDPFTVDVLPVPDIELEKAFMTRITGQSPFPVF